MVFNNNPGLKPRSSEPTPSSTEGLTPRSPALEAPEGLTPSTPEPPSSEKVAAGAAALPLRRRQAPAAQAATAKRQVVASSSIGLSSGQDRGGFAKLVANRGLFTAIAIGVGVVPVLALGAIAYNITNQGISETILRTQQATALETSELLNGLVLESTQNNTQSISLLGILRNSNVIENTTQEWKEDLLTRFLDRGFDSIIATNNDGSVNIGVGTASLNNFQSTLPFQLANEANGVIITPPIDIGNGIAAIYGAVPIENFQSGEQTGTLITRVPVTDINTQFLENADFLRASLEGFDTAETYATDAEGNIFAGLQDEESLGTNIAELYSCENPFSGGVQSELCTNRLNNQDYLVTFSPVVGADMSASSGLGTYVAQPTATLLAPQRTLRLTFGGGTIGAASLLGLSGIFLSQLLYRQQTSAEEQKEEREKMQSQVLTLLTDIDGASQGDLTVRADVSTGEIGTVADFFNSIVESLRNIVTQVKSAAGEVNTSLGVDEVSVRRLAEESLKQAEETTRTLNSVEEMTVSIQEVSESARRAAEVTRTVATTAEAGGAVMDRTVSSIVDLRETVAETAKKVKRLGESSQQISKVVSLINEIALQTNLLAINASIEAARAGEEGRGFAVVAEEVGKLAAQSATATKDIESIVQTIQLETNQVVEAMEVGTSQVVEGTQLVEETKLSLEKLFQASAEIDELVQSITSATVSQTETSQQVSELMKEIARISEQTSQSSRQVSDSLQKTVLIADDLQESVRAFNVGG